MYLRPRDVLIFEAIQRHGPLPSHYLYEFTKHLARDKFGFSKRLLGLVRAGLLARPQQLNHPLLFTDFKCYTLTDKSLEVLSQLGKKYQYATPVGGGYQHAFMSSCITANIELGCIEAGYKFISQEDILTSKQCPVETREAQKPLAIPSSISYEFVRANGTKYTHKSDRPTEPDQLFGIDYGTGFLFFALEADRGTEPLTRQNLSENSILRKVLSYKDILIRGEFKKRFGLPKVFPVFVTTADERVENMLALTREIYPNGSNSLLFKAIPGFHVYFRTPALLPQLFKESYKRTGEPFNISKV